MTLSGSGFPTNSTVYFGTTALPTSYSSSNLLYATLSSFTAVVGTFQVYVSSPSGSSNGQPVTVSSSGSGGTLSLTSLQPASIGTNAGSFTLTIFGSGFSQGQLVTFGSQTFGSTFLSSNEITVNIPGTAITTAQTVNVSEGSSNQLPFVIGSGGSTGTLSIVCNPSNGPTSIGIFFSQFCSVSGGNGSYLWAVVLGLPSGLTLNPTTGSSVGISGTPSTLNTYTVQVNDSSGHTGSLTVTSSGSTGTGNLSSISPSSASLGSGQITVILAGYGFTSASTAYFNGNVLATQYVSTSQLNATIPSNLLTTSGTYSIVVITSGSSSNSLPFVVGTSGTSGVVLSSISPTNAILNSPAVNLVLFGSGFSQGQLVSFGSNLFTATLVNSGELTVTIPSQYFTTAQTVNVSVAGSNSLQFVIGSGSTGTLSVSCSPAAGPATLSSYYSQTCSVAGGTAPYTWTVSSLPSGLTQSAYNGASSVTISGTPNVSQSYSYPVQVRDANGLTGSLTISGSVTTSGSSYNITSLSPSSASVGSAGITLTVFGNGFTNSSLVYFNNQLLTTQYISGTQLNATLPAYLLTTATSANVLVNTSGIATNSTVFTVGSGSTGGSLTVFCTPGVGPSTISTFYTTTCTASGGTQPYNWPTPTGLPAYLTYSATTGSSITISGTPTSSAAYNFLVKVTDSSSPAQTGSLQLAGQTSSSSSGTGGILLTSLSPSSAAVNSQAISITVNGSGFSTNSQVVFDGFAIVTTYLSGSQLLATVPAGLLTIARTALVSVMTSGVGTSNALTFTIGNGGSGVQVSINCSPGVGPTSPTSYSPTSCGVSGGVGPYTWSVVNGALPSGLSLTSTDRLRLPATPPSTGVIPCHAAGQR